MLGYNNFLMSNIDVQIIEKFIISAQQFHPKESNILKYLISLLSLIRIILYDKFVRMLVPLETFKRNWRNTHKWPFKNFSQNIPTSSKTQGFTDVGADGLRELNVTLVK